MEEEEGAGEPLSNSIQETISVLTDTKENTPSNEQNSNNESNTETTEQTEQNQEKSDLVQENSHLPNSNTNTDQDTQTDNQNGSSINNENNDGQMSSTFLTEAQESQLIQATVIEKNNDETNTQSNQDIQVTPQIDPEELEAAYNSLVKYQTIPPSHYFDSMVKYINRKRIEELENSDYREVEKLDSLLELLNQKNQDQANQQSIDEKEQAFKTRSDSLENRIQDINNRYDSKIKALQDQFETRFEELSANQEMEVMKFKEKWQNPDFIKQFDRPSKQLLTMRYQETRMALSKRYEDAKKAKSQADRLQRSEEANAQRVMEETMKAEFLRLRTHQQQEVNKLSLRNDSQLEAIEVQRKRELEPLKIALRQLEGKKKTRISLLTKSVPITIPQAGQNSPKSPRTAARFILYRNGVQTDINIAPIDDNQFLAMTKRTARQRTRAKSSMSRSLPPL